MSNDVNDNGKKYVLLSTALKSIKAEPELPGPMPDEIWNQIRYNRRATENLFKKAISQTKKGIMARLLYSIK